jgi:tetratricopeptide (TPR) repeat protein
MAAIPNTWTALASTLKNLSQFFPGQSDPNGEADLYYRRARLAAAEERFDVALVFCAKAIEVAPRHLASRLLIARIHDRGLNDLEAAVAGYKKVIALAGYDGADPHCQAAREALDRLVTSSELATRHS